MLVQIGAGCLSAVCCAFSWRAFQRCQAITAALPGAAKPPRVRAASAEAEADAPDALEQELQLCQLNDELNLAKRTVKGLAQVAFTGGLGLAFWALTGGRAHQPEASAAFALGAVGAVICLGLRRKIGSLADNWRSAANRKRRRQGVDQPERTG